MGEYQLDGAHDAFESLLFQRELLATGGSDGVVARPSVVLGDPPFSFHESVEQESLQRGVQRALADAKHAPRHRIHVLGDAGPVFPAVCDRLEDEEVERAGE